MVVVSTMKKRTSLLAVIPLGASLFLLGSLAFDPPGAEKRPVPSFSMTVNGQPLVLDREVDVQNALETIDFEPMQTDFLETVLLQGTVGDKKAAIRELRRMGGSDAVATLSMALADDDPRVRKATFEALSRIGGDEALAAIASATGAADPEARARAAEALANAGGYSAASYLELALRDDDARVRLAATEALGDLDDSDSINIISTALRDPDPEVRQRAAEMLDQLNDDAFFHAVFPPQ
jgi:HEAT repeat protein